MENTSLTSVNTPSRAGFSAWIRDAGGAGLAGCERERLAQLLPGLFGYYALQIGYHSEGMLDSARRIRSKFELRLDADGVHDSRCAALGSAAALPFALHSIDVVVLPHVLEYAAQPDAVLAEIERVLIEDGRLIIAGFNPWSLWGLPRLYPPARKRPPWDGRFHSATDISCRLAALGFEVVATERFWFRLPCQGRPRWRRLLLLERQGAWRRPFCGAAWIMVAQKRRAPVTPAKLKWHKKLLWSGAPAGTATMAAPEVNEGSS